ncbi:MAG: hypothetical protein K0S71_121 [Clostridia bacterium]|jgi:predicted  nucleic acid-binding Zn ribbon protein|nr:hypothetical protein [Clostridia bacterium]
MSIEKRMQDFEKVSEKQFAAEDVSKRMEEFDKVTADKKRLSNDKTGALPYGLKRYRPCPHCGEFMEIQEVMADGANYLCSSCHKVSKIKLES